MVAKRFVVDGKWGASKPFESIHRSSTSALSSIRLAWALAISRIVGSIPTRSRTSTVKTGLACCPEYFTSVIGVLVTVNPKTRYRFHIRVTGSSSNESAGAFIEEGETGPQNRPRWLNVF